jgi:hypothetical protein
MAFQYKRTGCKAREAPVRADSRKPDLKTRTPARRAFDPVAYAAVIEILG